MIISIPPHHRLFRQNPPEQHPCLIETEALGIRPKQDSSICGSRDTFSVAHIYVVLKTLGNGKIVFISFVIVFPVTAMSQNYIDHLDGPSYLVAIIWAIESVRQMHVVPFHRYEFRPNDQQQVLVVPVIAEGALPLPFRPFPVKQQLTVPGNLPFVFVICHHSLLLVRFDAGKAFAIPVHDVLVQDVHLHPEIIHAEQVWDGVILMAD